MNNHNHIIIQMIMRPCYLYVLLKNRELLGETFAIIHHLVRPLDPPPQ